MLQLSATSDNGQTDPYSSSARMPAARGLLRLINSLDENTLLLGVDNGEILWATDSCVSLQPSLSKGRLRECAPDLFNSVDWTAVSQSQGGWQPMGEWNVESEAGVKRSFRISALADHEGSAAVWLRLTETTHRQDYFEQYLADLNDVFCSSGSMSVGEMATTLAHELNQPIGALLNIVRGVRQRLTHEGHGSEEIFGALDLAERQGGFAADIISRIRDISQSRRPRVVDCNVSRLIGDTVVLLNWIFDSEQVEVDLQIPDQQLTIAGDLTLLQQVLVNLLRNSVESMCDNAADNKVICVRAALEDNMVAVDIIDRGHGLPARSEDYLFSPFVSEKPDGMGVGLNICRSFVELQHGRLWVSANESGGCTAHLRFPQLMSPVKEE